MSAFARISLLISCVVGPDLSAWAAVEISDHDGLPEIRVSDERNIDVLGRLAERLGFAYSVSDPEWAATRRDFAMSGTPERIIKGFLVGENYIFGYAQPENGQPGAIASVDVLGHGEAINYRPKSMSQEEPRVGPGALTRSEKPRHEDEHSESPHRVTELMRSRISPTIVEMKPAKASPISVSRTETGVAAGAPVVSDETQKQLQRLTQQAQRDVAALAEALKAAETSMGSESPQ
jgi:hypothetical protein